MRSGLSVQAGSEKTGPGKQQLVPDAPFPGRPGAPIGLFSLRPAIKIGQPNTQLVRIYWFDHRTDRHILRSAVQRGRSHRSGRRLPTKWLSQVAAAHYTVTPR